MRASGAPPHSPLHAGEARVLEGRREAELLGPAEAELGRTRLEWARRQVGRRVRQVETARRNVVRRVRVEQRGEVLDLAAARTQLELAAAVGADPARLAVVVGGEQLVQ